MSYNLLTVIVTALGVLCQLIQLSATNTGVIIPLYIYPGDSWNALNNLIMNYPNVPVVVIVNVDNGPGLSVDANYASGIRMLQSNSNVVTLGYVDTAYGQRDQNSVTDDITRWQDYYSNQIEGIFLDNMDNSYANIDIYKNYSTYIKEQGLSYVYGNAGTDVPPDYLDDSIIDNIVVYESAGWPSVSMLNGSDGWHSKYDKSSFSFLAYNVTVLNSTVVQILSNYVGYMYVTSDIYVVNSTDSNYNNPYNSISPYLGQLLQLFNIASNITSALNTNGGTTQTSSNNMQTTNNNTLVNGGNILKTSSFVHFLTVLTLIYVSITNGL